MAKLISEYKDLGSVQTIIEEGVAGETPKKYYITGSFLKADSRNQNGNLYPRHVIEQCIAKFKKDKILNNRAVGELNHPHTPEIDLGRVSHIIEDLYFEGDDVVGKARLLDTTQGKEAKALVDGGLSFGVSLRALGAFDDEQVMTEGMTLIAIDLVADPSFATSFVDPILESKEWLIDEEGNIKEAIVTVEEDDVNTQVDIIKFSEYMKDATKADSMFYEDNTINAIIEYGVKKGWAKRDSVTQVEWTKKGLSAYNDARELQDALDTGKNETIKQDGSYTIQEADIAKQSIADHVGLWYEDPAINDVIVFATKKGWMYRPSITQVEWTDFGVKTLKESGIQEESFVITDSIKEDALILESVKESKEQKLKAKKAEAIRTLFKSVYK